MNKILILSVVAFLASTCAIQAQRTQQPGQRQQPGQGGPGGFGGGGGGLKTMLATSKPLQEELKLSEDQITKIKEYVEKNARGGMGGGGFGGFGAGFGGGGGGTDDESRIESLKAQIKAIEERAEFFKKTLDATQFKRITQIERQQMGLGIFSNSKIAEELKLTDAQNTRVKEINADLQKEQREAFPRGNGGARPDFTELQKKMNELRDFAKEAIEKELTGEQKDKVKEMIGEKFDTSKLFQRPMPNNNN